MGKWGRTDLTDAFLQTNFGHFDHMPHQMCKDEPFWNNLSCQPTSLTPADLSYMQELNHDRNAVELVIRAFLVVWRMLIFAFSQAWVLSQKLVVSETTSGMDRFLRYRNPQSFNDFNLPRCVGPEARLRGWRSGWGVVWDSLMPSNGSDQ